jgi:hypothetical protein
MPRIVTFVSLLLAGCHWLLPFGAGGSDGSARDARGSETGPSDRGGDGPRGDGGPPPLTGLCRSGFCWERPLPQGSALRGIAGRGTDVFFVGAAGTILRYDSSGQWHSYETGTGARFHAIWRTGAGLLLAGGPGVRQLPAGASAWTNPAAGFTTSVGGLWGIGDDMFASCGSGKIFHGTSPYDSWTAQDAGASEDLEGISGASSGSEIGVFAAGYGGTVRRSAGDGSWAVVPSGTTADLQAVWGVSPGEAVAVGDSGTILRCTTALCSNDVAGLGVTNNLSAVWGNSSYLLAAGASGQVFRRDTAGTWKQTAATGTGRTIETIWGEKDVFLAGSAGVVLRYDGAAFRAIGGIAPDTGKPITGTSLEDVWSDGAETCAVGDDGLVLRRAGTAWARETAPDLDLFAVWDGIAVGEGGSILRREPAGAWTKMDSPAAATLYGIWRDRATGLGFAVGSGGALLRLEGGIWSVVASGVSLDLLDVHGSGPANVVAVGAGGVILRFDGSWRQVGQGVTSATLNGVFVVDGQLAFAVGNGSTLLRCKAGDTWEELSPPGLPGSEALSSVWASGDKDVWLGAENGLLLHYDGAAAKPVLTGHDDDITSIAADGAGGLFIVGNSGTILHKNP